MYLHTRICSLTLIAQSLNGTDKKQKETGVGTSYLLGHIPWYLRYRLMFEIQKFIFHYRI